MDTMNDPHARLLADVGGTNALTGALNTGLNYYQNQNLMNKFSTPSSVGTNYNNLGTGFDANAWEGYM